MANTTLSSSALKGSGKSTAVEEYVKGKSSSAREKFLKSLVSSGTPDWREWYGRDISSTGDYKYVDDHSSSYPTKEADHYFPVPTPNPFESETKVFGKSLSEWRQIEEQNAILLKRNKELIEENEMLKPFKELFMEHVSNEHGRS